MVVYKSLLQKSLSAIDIWDIKMFSGSRSRKSLSNVFIKYRHSLGNPTFMSLVWFFIWLLVSGLEIWFSFTCDLACDRENSIPPYDIVNIIVMVFLVVLGLTLLTVQKCITVSDSFRINSELTWKTLVIAIFFVWSYLILETHIIVYSHHGTYFIMSFSIELLLQIFITDYHLWKITFKKTVKKRSTLTLDMVLKDEEWFARFQDQLKQEFSVENLNFLVSCIHYCRSVMLQGDFGIESSSSNETEFDNEGERRLNWRKTLASVENDPNEIARFIFEEYCQQGAPQEVNLTEQMRKRLAGRMKMLLNVCNYAERDIFSEAFDCIYNLLSNDSMLRFNQGISVLHPKLTRNKIISDLEVPLLI